MNEGRGAAVLYFASELARWQKLTLHAYCYYHYHYYVLVGLFQLYPYAPEKVVSSYGRCPVSPSRRTVTYPFGCTIR